MAQLLQGTPPRGFESSSHDAAAAQSYLRPALEALLDLGRHVISKGFGRARGHAMILGSGRACRVLLWLLPGAIACGSDSSDSEAHLPVVRDSAGVRIVESPAPTWSEGERWHLSAQPRLELTPDPEDEELLVHEVTGLTVLPDGSVAIANMGDNSVRLYDGAGELVWKAGRSGDGPEEFRQVRGLYLRQGELWATQLLPNPIKVFDLDGRFLRSEPAPADMGVQGPWLAALFPDGSLLVRGLPFGEREGRVREEESTVVRVGSDRADTLAVLPMRRVVDIPGIRAEQQALGPHLVLAVHGEALFAGFTNRWEITEHDRSGKVVRRIRKSWDPQPVTAHHREAYAGEIMEEAAGAPELAAAYRQLADGMVYPESHRAYGSIHVDATGALWVSRTDTEPPWNEGAIDYVPVPPRSLEWDVFDPDGVWLGVVETPERFLVMEIGSDYVAGVWKDDLDLQWVRVHDLVKP